MYSPDLYSPGDIVSILSSHEMEPNGIIVAGEKVIYNSSVKKNPVFNSVTRDYMVIKTDNETRNDGALSDRVDIKVAVMRKIKADDLSSSLWFPKKVVIMTDNRRFETTAWTHCSNSRDDSLCSDEPHSSAEHNTITSSNMALSSESNSLDDLDCSRCSSTQDSDPSLSSINASSWYSPQNPTLPSTSSPSTTECFRLSPLTNEVSINTLSLANRSSPLNIANNDEEGDKHTNNEERFGIEVRRFNIPVNVYSRNSRHLSSSCSATTVSNGYPCFVEGCTSILRNRTALRKHAKVHAERTHSCEQCGRRFAEKTKLNRHMLTHTGEKAFKCERSGCSKTFSLESNLKSHMKTHTGEKPYSCQFCDHAFSHPYNLRVHISRRHKDKNTS